MVTKSRKQTTGKQQTQKGRVKVGKLHLNKETVKNLTGDEARKIKGGARLSEQHCATDPLLCATNNDLTYCQCIGRAK